MRLANVYVDGFNLYYGVVKDSPQYKWLDLGSLSRALLLRDQTLHRIRYFTAPVEGRTVDPGQPARQEAYLAALKTVSGLSIHKGQFQESSKARPLQKDPGQIVRILDTEEKGSDVNLATFLLLDAFKKDAEVSPWIRRSTVSRKS